MYYIVLVHTYIILYVLFLTKYDISVNIVLECTNVMVRNDVKQISHSMSEEKYNKIKKMWINSKSDKKLSGWLLELAMDTIEKNEFINKIAPRLSLLVFNEESIVIQDDQLKKTRLSMIIIRDGKLWCDLDEKYDCGHIHYVLTLSQLSRIKDKLKQI